MPMKKIKSLIFLCIAIFLFMSGTVLFADNSEKTEEMEQPEGTVPGLVLDTNIAAAVNYLGLRWTNSLYYRIPLVRKPGVLWNSTKIDIGVSDELTPSFHRISAMLQIEPIALFDLKVLAGYDIQWAALTGGIFSVPDPTTVTDWGTKFADVYDENTIQTGHGFVLKVMPTVKAAVGPVAALYTFTLGYHTYNVNTSTGYFYHAETSSVQLINDWYMVHDAKLLVQFYDFRAGANFVVTDITSWDYMSMKLTGLLVYTPTWNILPDGLDPYAVLQMGSFIMDQYNTGKFSFAVILGVTTKL